MRHRGVAGSHRGVRCAVAPLPRVPRRAGRRKARLRRRVRPPELRSGRRQAAACRKWKIDEDEDRRADSVSLLAEDDAAALREAGGRAAALLDGLRDASELAVVALTSRRGLRQDLAAGCKLRRELIAGGARGRVAACEATDDSATFIPALLASLRMAIDSICRRDRSTRSGRSVRTCGSRAKSSCRSTSSRGRPTS